MKTMEHVIKTELPLPLIGRGKVRDIYKVGEDKILMVTSDRLSAFDVILPNPIPYKGRVLTQISVFWLNYFSDLVPNHLITVDIHKMGFPQDFMNQYGQVLDGRSMLVKKAKPFPVECIVRGYVAGSGWKDYQKTGAICGHVLPKGLRQCEQLPEPIFTPSTKAEVGHDENIDFDQAVKLVGRAHAEKLRDLTIAIYKKGAEYAKTKGIIIADTKFEFGLLDGKMILIDEVMSPDSSRFWPADRYQAGQDQPSYDKQIVRNYLSSLDWDKTPPAPALPEEIVEKTSQAYRDVYERLVGKPLT